MTQDQDLYGWHDRRHWRGGWLQIYANRDDPRLWVPKRRPGIGWTLNVLHPKARLVLAALGAFVAGAVVMGAVAGK